MKLPAILIALPLATPALSQFATQVPFPSGQLGDLEAVDFDGDGDLDVVAMSLNSSSLVVMENMGGNTLASPVPLTATPFTIISRFDMVDLNGDGQLDIVATNGALPQLSWFPGVGGGMYAAAQQIESTFPSFQPPADVAADDLDGDGTVDLVVATPTGLYKYEGLGGGSFGPRTQFDPTSVVRTTLADLDADGRPDVVSTAVSGNIIVNENVGGLAFGPSTIVAAALSHAVGDVDGDGLLDLAVGMPFQGFFWVQNTGGVGFGPPQPVESGFLSTSFVGLGDLDGDGDDDYLAFGALAGGLGWFENLGGGAFTTRYDVEGTLLGSGDLQAVDLNGDGENDFVHSFGWNPYGSFLGERYCTSVANSTGVPGRIDVRGSSAVVNNNLTLAAADLPSSVFGFFLTSPMSSLVMQPGGSFGNLCLGGAIGRYVGPGQIQQSSLAGTFELRIDLTQMPDPATGSVMAQPGSTWHFQAWFRDTLGGNVGSNFTDGFRVTFM